MRGTDGEERNGRGRGNGDVGVQKGLLHNWQGPFYKALEQLWLNCLLVTINTSTGSETKPVNYMRSALTTAPSDHHYHHFTITLVITHTCTRLQPKHLLYRYYKCHMSMSHNA